MGAFLPLLFALAVVAGPSPRFVERQLSAPRVASARENTDAIRRELFEAAGVRYPAEQLLLRSFKASAELEVWAGNAGGVLHHIKTFPVCADSGELGPKRRRGDLQVPEGFYTVNRFNPNSAYHLGLGINYPNQSDRQLGYKPNLGGSILLHGDCVTIGCIPIEDEPMEELYVIALDTYLTGRAVHVHIYPRHLDTSGLTSLEATTDDAELIAFWRNLAPGYRLFQETRRMPVVRVDKRGRYRVR